MDVCDRMKLLRNVIWLEAGKHTLVVVTVCEEENYFHV